MCVFSTHLEIPFLFSCSCPARVWAAFQRTQVRLRVWMRAPHARGTWVCGSGACCQGSRHTQWAAHPGGSWLVSRVWAGNVQQAGCFLCAWGGWWPGVFTAALPPAVTVLDSVGQKDLCQVPPGECPGIKCWGNPLSGGVCDTCAGQRWEAH